MIVRDKHSSLLDRFISYVSWIRMFVLSTIIVLKSFVNNSSVIKLFYECQKVFIISMEWSYVVSHFYVYSEWHYALSLFWVVLCSSVAMLRFMPSVAILNVDKLKVSMVCLIMLSVYNMSFIVLSATMLSSLCWMSLCWVSLFYMPLCWVPLCWVSLCWVSLWWVSWWLVSLCWE